MSREIKFRVWDIENEEYRNGDDVLLRYDGSAISRYALGALDTDMPVNVIIEQYTGLKDKHGKEIYEGDIVESTWNGDKAEVVWNDVEGEWEHYADFNTHSKYSGSVVIGNIHENPELLGGEDDN